METINCIWLGPPGTHGIAGDVATGKKLKLSHDDYSALLGHGLVKEDEPEQKTTKVKEKK